MDGIESQTDFPSIFICLPVCLSICLQVSVCIFVWFNRHTVKTHERLHNIYLMLLFIFSSPPFSSFSPNSIRKNFIFFHCDSGVPDPKMNIKVTCTVTCKIANKIVRMSCDGMAASTKQNSSCITVAYDEHVILWQIVALIPLLNR